MIKLVVNRLENRLDLGKVTNPAGMRVDLPFDEDGDTERVPVQASTFVPCGHVWQQMRRFEYEFLEQFHAVTL